MKFTAPAWATFVGVPSGALPTLLLCLAACLTASPSVASAQTALAFDGTDAYVTFGQAPSLGSTTFTIETWFRRDGAGTTANTGTGGVIAVPLVTKGRGELDGDTRDMNYFLGIRGSDGVLVADFEEGAGGSSPGLNHAVAGTTPITTGVWHHAAAAYDGTTWRLYLDGYLEAELTVGEPPQSQSIQHAALATALNSHGTPQGFFDGALDEVRIWNVARTQAEIRATIDEPITAPQPGLVGRWGLDEGSGTVAYASAGTSVDGTITGTGWAWTAGAPFDDVFDEPPDPPVLIAPSDGATGLSLTPNLEVAVADPEGTAVTVTWFGRSPPSAGGAPFAIVVLPDTQYYSAGLYGGSPEIFQAQTQWIVDNLAARNIVYVDHVGDIVEDGDDKASEWANAWSAMATLEDPVATGMPEGIPYSADVGNHDETPIGDPDGTTTFYNQYFGVAHFTGRAYYGGHYGSNNDNHFSLFSASGYDFIVVSLEFDGYPNDRDALAWADSVLAAYPNRWGIVSSHYLIGTGNPASFSPQGQATYDALADNPNLFLMICGHVTGEGRRSDAIGGRVIHTLMADYQNRDNGGDGWLRILTFYPSEELLRVKTYSPTLDQYEADADSSSQFTLPIGLTQSPSWEVLGTQTVASGVKATLIWPDREPMTDYEWYATVSDGNTTTTGPVWGFTTGAGPTAVRPGATPGFALALRSSNPSGERSRFEISVPRQARVVVAVYDVAGRRVAVLADRVFRRGVHSLTWAGHTAGGRAPSGVYFVRMAATGFHATRKVVLLR